MKTKILAAILLITFSATSTAGTVIGEGNASCGQYLEQSATLEKANLPAPANAWALGFLSALSNFAYTKDILDQTDAFAIKGALKQYCQSHPLDNLLSAALSVADQLSRRIGANAMPTPDQPPSPNKRR